MHFSVIRKFDEDDNLVFDQEEMDIHGQSFSSIDRKKDLDDKGIVYPYDENETITNGIVSSSIIDHHDDDKHLIKHTEIRICNTNEKDDLEYQLIQASASIVLTDTEESIARDYFFANNLIKTEDMYYESRDMINEQWFKTFDKCIQIYKDFTTAKVISDRFVEEKTIDVNLFAHDQIKRFNLFGDTE